MKLFSFFILFFLFLSGNVVAQKIIKHKVKSGESIYAIAKKYDVTEKEIYDMNPKLKGAVLGLKTEVKIPNKKYKAKESNSKAELAQQKKLQSAKNEEVAIVDQSVTTRHLVTPKETLYSISKKYNVTMESLCEMNPELKTGNLKSGMRLKLPYAALPEVPVKAEETPTNLLPTAEVILASPNNDGDIIHKVQPKETLFRISKKYNITIAELQQLNPSVVSGLPVGYDLIIKKSDKKSEEALTTVSSVSETVSEVVNVSPQTIENLSKAEILIAKASENLGARYRSGGTTPAGFDCSGLMYATFKNIDMTLPRSSYDMAKYGQRIDRSQAQKGDLIFFATFGRGRVSHVGMVTEVLDDEIKFIHSSTQSGVIISSTKEDYYSRTFVQVNRVLAQ